MDADRFSTHCLHLPNLDHKRQLEIYATQPRGHCTDLELGPASAASASYVGRSPLPDASCSGCGNRGSAMGVTLRVDIRTILW